MRDLFVLMVLKFLTELGFLLTDFKLNLYLGDNLNLLLVFKFEAEYLGKCLFGL